MFDHAVTHAVSLVGLGIQTALTLLLSLLFAVLARAGTERRYFASWTKAWFLFLAGLVALCFAFASASSPLAQRTLNFVYQAGKMAFFLELAKGVWIFAAGPGRELSRRVTFIPFALALAVSVPFLGNIEDLVGIQALLAVPALTWAARQMASTPAPRRTATARVAASTLAAMAVLWALYLAELATRSSGLYLHWAVRYVVAGFNSYVDLLLETLLAFAMVLLRAEDAQRELVEAHEALEEAHARLRDKSLHDPLTEVLNRRAFDEAIGFSPGSGGTVVALDLDGLKPVNDRWGHPVGDALLRHFAATMKAQLRESDRLYRTGGDEFVVIAPGADKERLSARIAHALSSMGELPASGDHPAIPVVASWGAVAFATAAELEEALRAADALMYERKRAARAGVETRPGVLPHAAPGS